jgi:hypothetical protein
MRHTTHGLSSPGRAAESRTVECSLAEILCATTNSYLESTVDGPARIRFKQLGCRAHQMRVHVRACKVFLVTARPLGVRAAAKSPQSAVTPFAIYPLVM